MNQIGLKLLKGFAQLALGPRGGDGVHLGFHQVGQGDLRVVRHQVIEPGQDLTIPSQGRVDKEEAVFGPLDVLAGHVQDVLCGRVRIRDGEGEIGADHPHLKLSEDLSEVR